MNGVIGENAATCVLKEKKRNAAINMYNFGGEKGFCFC